jgi:thioredoxin 1
MSIMYFSAAWCGPCKMFKPIVQKVSQDLGTYVNYVDVDQNPDLVKKHSISSVPTIVITDDDGNQVFRQSGVIPTDQLINAFSKFK